MSLHLNLSTGKFLNSSTLFKLSDALLLDVSSGEIVMSNLLVPRVGVDLATITYGITNAGGVFNLRSTGTVDYEVEWGDGAVEISTLNTLPHTYTAGNYDLVVYSDGVYRPYFNDETDDVSQITSVVIGSGADLGTNLQSAWEGAVNMTSFVCPFDVTSGVTSFYRAWFKCSSLTSFPLIDTSLATSFIWTWRFCGNLTGFPLIDTSSATTLQRTWESCTSLAGTFPLIDSSSVTDFSYAWNTCSSLTGFQQIDTSSGTNFNSAWRSCGGLTAFPAIDTSSGTNFVECWQSCTGLSVFPPLNMSSGTNFFRTWRICTGLTSFPSIDVSSGTNFNAAWQGASSLNAFPANMFDTTGTLIATAFQSTWFNCALTAQSIENILVSLDTNGASNITLGINGGTNAGKTTWSTAAVTAYDNLIVKGWTITFNA